VEVERINDQESWITTNPYWLHFACMGFWFFILLLFSSESVGTHVKEDYYKFRLGRVDSKNRKDLKKMF